ncbi:MAG: putative N-acetylmannosamine-6-phosphate epimerase [Acidimicrobiaceae bacterium]|jgi:N-acylglucosamine-6-phosphate 2-epimerase|nr:putative N-acetylmannosamine-6-phosphate epimerase [Acidimicrobiaceae bacterium]
MPVKVVLRRMTTSLEKKTLARLTGGLVVSCQAPVDHPFAHPAMIAALCRCAELGGAVGVRVNGTESVRLAKANGNLVVIGIQKVSIGEDRLTNDRPAITPGRREAAALADAGADMIAFEATRELHGDRVAEVVAEIRSEVGMSVMADVSTVEEGHMAFAAGADVVASTLAGHTTAAPLSNGPDLTLVASLASEGVLVAAEGRINSPLDAVAAMQAGALFVVVGRAITDPVGISLDFSRALASTDVQRDKRIGTNKSTLRERDQN